MKKEKGEKVIFAVIALVCIAAIAYVIFLRAGVTAPPEPETAGRSETVSVPPAEKKKEAYASLSAFEVGELFTFERDGNGTKNYVTVYAPDISSLKLEEPQYTDGREIFRLDRENDALPAFEKFAETYFEPMRELSSVKQDNYTIEKDGEGAYFLPVYRADIFENSGEDQERYDSLMLNARGDFLEMYATTSEEITVDGTMYRLSDTMTDGEITEFLGDARGYLSGLFGAELSGTKIVRRFSEKQLRTIAVYFYAGELADLPETLQEAPMAELCVCLNFYTFWGEGTAHPKNCTDSGCMLQCVELIAPARPWEDIYVSVGKAPALDLIAAEDMLEKGYCFGAHSCPFCMAAQPEVSFAGKDLSYGYEYVTGESGLCVPFCTFYRDLGENEHGMEKFAKTYVSAVELDGIDEYFEQQEAYHYRASLAEDILE